MRFSPLGSISRIRQWLAELIFNVITGDFVSLVFISAHVHHISVYVDGGFEPSQHKSRASAARMPGQHYTLWTVTAPAPGRSHTLTRFQYGLIETVREQPCNHKTLTLSK